MQARKSTVIVTIKTDLSRIYIFLNLDVTVLAVWATKKNKKKTSTYDIKNLLTYLLILKSL